MTSINTAHYTLEAQPKATPLVPASDAATAASSSFGEVLDAINPLQHIPVVSNLFRASQGAAISPVAQLVGDTLYGGLIGGAISSFVSSLADVAVKGVTGQSISEHVVSTVTNAAKPVPAQGSALVAVTGVDVATATMNKEEIAKKVDEATALILRTDAHPERVAAQYQRAQTLDIGNKLLLTAGS